ncbi:unnamed protein product [Ixodes pacificus]
MWSQLPEHPIWTDGPEAAPREEGARRPAGHVDSDSSDDAPRERASPGLKRAACTTTWMQGTSPKGLPARRSMRT